MYSIKAASQATGLTAETLRAWERRYGVVVPRRDSVGRRVYGPDDVLRLRLLHEATDRGHPISRLAGLGNEELARLVGQPASPTPSAAASGFAARILTAVVEFRAADCEQALTLAVALLPPQQLFIEVLHPLLTEVGERWHSGQLTVSQERLASSTIRRHLGLVLESYERAAGRPAIVLATLPGERHELGLLMAAVMCACRGFKVHYLGTELPAVEIARFAKAVGASIVGVSVVMTEGVDSVPEQLAALVAELGPGISVWIGGGAGQQLDPETLPPRCSCVRDALELRYRLDLLAA
jgi:methanogenic corrinoid protein MtbC1